jgi:hypothetical protein
MKHTPHSHHVHILMNGHNPEHQRHKNVSRETSNVKPCDILMRQHHYNGGVSAAVMPYSKGGEARRYAKGGHVDHESHGGSTYRKRHYAGGISNIPPDYAEGGDVADKYESKVGYRRPEQSPFSRTMKKGGYCYADGGETKREYGEKPVTGQLRRGGRAKHYYYEGESVKEGSPVQDNSVRSEKRNGGRTKRQHHYWGQDVIGRIPLIGHLANSIAHTVGTLDPHQYGGAEYKADTPGKKAADIISTVGGVLPMAVLKSGGRATRKYRYHHAEGGAGKVRKGMMDESGHMIYHQI